MKVTLQQLSFTSGVWSPSLYSRTDIKQYAGALKTLQNMIVHPHGGASNRGGTQFIKEVKDSTKKVRLIPFQFSVEQAYVLEFGDLYFRIYMDGGRVENPPGTPVEVVTTYVEADLPLLKFIQSADTLYITHPSYPPRKVTRTAHITWSINNITFGSTVAAPTSLAATPAGAATDPLYVVTALDSTFRESIASNSTNCANGSVLNWTAPAGTISYYNIYMDQSVSGVYGWVGKSNSNTFTIPSGGFEPDFTKSPPEAITQFTTTDNYPAVCTFFEQRLLFSRTNNYPQTIWGSVVGDYENMNRSAFTSADDAFEFTINAREVNEVRWLVPLDVCMIGTSGSEWKMEPGRNADAVSALSVSMKQQSKWGSSDVPPLVIGNSVLFVENSGAAVKDLTYSYEIDGYKATALMLFSKHLFEGFEVVSWCYQQEPDSIVWAVRDDGTLLGLTYYREQNVFAWHEHTTNGLFEDITCIRSDAGEDEVYVVVNRTIEGATKRYVERFMPRLPYNDSFEIDVEDSYFVDSGLTYDSTPATTFSNLDHLEGEEVSVLADGNVVSGKTVSSGQIVLDNAASVVHIGLAYESVLESLDFVAQSEGGTIQDKVKDVKSIVLSLQNTRALWYGPSSDRLVEAAFREDEDYGDPTELYTGDKEFFLEAGQSRESKVYIKNTDPLPLTILAILPRLEYGDS
jgi:hypothetical protein